jgi:hypothetical protein
MLKAEKNSIPLPSVPRLLHVANGEFFALKNRNCAVMTSEWWQLCTAKNTKEHCKKHAKNTTTDKVLRALCEDFVTFVVNNTRCVSS